MWILNPNINNSIIRSRDEIEFYIRQRTEYGTWISICDELETLEFIDKKNQWNDVS